jgi:hypothetical protein
MRRSIVVLPLVLAVSLSSPAAAGPARTYKGKATSTDATFKYGPVTIKRSGTKVTLVKVESVTTTGCGGFMTVIFAPKDKETQIVKGSATIKGNRLSVTYRPVRSIENQTTTISATFKGSKVTGTFKSGNLCGNAGRFTAKG